MTDPTFTPGDCAILPYYLSLSVLQWLYLLIVLMAINMGLTVWLITAQLRSFRVVAADIAGALHGMRAALQQHSQQPAGKPNDYPPAELADDLGDL